MNKRAVAAISNVIGFVVVIVMNTLAVVLPLNNKTTGELSDQYPNLFTPAGFTFSIWSVIYLALLLFIIYQTWMLFKKRKGADDILSITPYFLLSCLANASWIAAWHYEQVMLSVIIMLVLLGSLIIIHNRLSLALAWRPLSDKLLVDFPFSIYFGWITIATVANMTALLVSQNVRPLGLSEVIWTNVVIAVATLITLLVLFTRRNVFYSLVPCWAFYGIIIKNKSVAAEGADSIIMVAEICIGVILLACVVSFIFIKNSTRRRELQS